MQNGTKNNSNTDWRREQKVCQEEILIQLDSAKNTPMLASRHIIFQHQTWVKIPALERERLRGWKYEKAPHFYRFFARLGYSPTPFLRYNTTSSAASIIHTFFRYVTQAWAHRIFLRVFIVMDRRYAFSWIFLHSNDKERSIIWKIFAQDFYEFVAQNFLLNNNIEASLWLHLKHWLRRGFILFTTANFFICTIKW